MEATIYQRIKYILDEKSISVNALAKQISVAQATLNPQLRGDRTLAANIVEKILIAFPDISAEWVMRGNGNMLLSDNVTSLAKSKDDALVSSPMCAADEESIWQAKYEELEKRYEQLLTIISDIIGKNKNNKTVVE